MLRLLSNIVDPGEFAMQSILMPEFNEKDALIKKLGFPNNKSISFLVGAPFSVHQGLGVPGVDDFLKVIGEHLAEAGPQYRADFDREIGKSNGPGAYQDALKYLYTIAGPDFVYEVVQRAVLKARKAGAPVLDPKRFGDGIAPEWNLTPAQRGLAALVQSDLDKYSGPILTSNFDPMIELALREKALDARPVSIPIDRPLSTVTVPLNEKNVYHLHGFWRDKATLHTQDQLEDARAVLKNSLKRMLDNTHLVVMAYGGWDDIFTRSIFECVEDPEFGGTISWCFYDNDANGIEARDAALLERLRPGLTNGRVVLFKGIDCHSIFDELVPSGVLTVTDGVAADASPMPGWTLVDKAKVAALEPLTKEETARYYDGAVPTLRHSIDSNIPALTSARLLIERTSLEGASSSRMLLVRAAGGEGKSTCLLQTAAAIAQSGAMNVLLRDGTDMKLDPSVLMQLPPDKDWLIVADDAEALIEDIWQAAQRLHEEGRKNVFFLLAVRDTDWRAEHGDARAWDSVLERLDDAVLQGLSEADAKEVVEAWGRLGDEGLRDLAKVEDVDERAAKFYRVSQSEAGKRDDEGSFYGALLKVRLGPKALKAHLAPILARLEEKDVIGGETTLKDALIAIANCHATGMPGIERKVLATLCGIRENQVATRILRPLGRELGAAERSVPEQSVQGRISHSYVLTRHRSVAEAILVVAEQSGTSLEESWQQLVSAAIRVSKNAPIEDQVGETYAKIVLAGSDLHHSLPEELDHRPEGLRRKGESRVRIGIAAAGTAFDEMPEWSSVIPALARAYRAAGRAEEGADLLQKELRGQNSKATDAKDKFRGYLCEWAACHSQIGGNPYKSRIANAWLASLSLSDMRNSPDEFPLVEYQVHRSVNGLCHGFEKLWDNDPKSEFALAHSAAVAVARRVRPDARLRGTIGKHSEILKARGILRPENDEQLFGWLQEGANAAWRDADPSVRIQNTGRLSFNKLRAFMSGS